MNKTVIVEALRTPMGKLLGSLSRHTAPQLSSFVIKEIIKKTNSARYHIDEVIMGSVVSAGIGQNPARQSALLSGLSDTTAAFTVNKVCASGMKAVALGAQAIEAGEAEIIIAGGMESMSSAPFLLKEMRAGKKHGNSEATDAMLIDGLWDCYYNAHMGTLCESTVERYSITRKDQDAFAVHSHKKAALATGTGMFKDEIVPVPSGTGWMVEEDETIRRDTDINKLSRLHPVFMKDGTITAGNSPGLNDGAAALLLMSERKAKKLGLKPIAEVLGYASGHLDPKWYTMAPLGSVLRVLKKTGLKLTEIDLVEENEAFAAQTLAIIRELNLNPEKLNVHGGAIALGHPIGASGARILVTLIHALRQRGAKTGLATICLGGGGAFSMAVRVI